MPERILIVEDDGALRDLLTDLLSEAGYQCVGFPNAAPALQSLEASGEADLVITDLMMPGIPGEDLLRMLRSRWPEINVIVLTAFGSIDSAIELVKGGAFNYLTKPVGTDELLLTVERALQENRLRREVAARVRVGGASLPEGMIGASRPIQELASLIARTAASPHAVLITGESGTGKELVARALHRASGRGPFVAVNCGALPEHLLESELFGHQRGAFTGADQTHRGLFEAADQGTLLLDEIAEMPLPLQPKLLRALENGEVRRVGASQSTTVNVRIVAATNRDLAQEVEAGRFREDLFWRLNVLHLEVPPLRDRPADVVLLSQHFLQAGVNPGGEAKRLAPETLSLLSAYHWPGNVRELRNAIQHAQTLAPSDLIYPADLPPRIHQQARLAGTIATAAKGHLPLRDVERAYVLEILKEANGNKSRAAEILGLDRKTLYRKLEEYGREETPP